MKRVVIVGAGPSGIFAALQLRTSQNVEILMFEEGPPLEKRLENRRKYMVTGWGGAGAFSDGKITLSPDVGGWLSEVLPVHALKEKLTTLGDLIRERTSVHEFNPNSSSSSIFYCKKALSAGMRLLSFPIIHVGTDNLIGLLEKLYKEISEFASVRFNSKVERVMVEDGKAKGVVLENGETVEADYVLLGPGRKGAKWLRDEAERIGIPTQNNPLDIGVRVEVPASVMEPLTEIFYEPKIVYYTEKFDDKTRTFCVNPYGEVVEEKYESVVLVNGHAMANKKLSDNTNFALLVSVNFTEPFKSPIQFGLHLGQLANMISDGVIVQRFGDLKRGRRSTTARLKRNSFPPTLTTATPGDLGLVVPYRILWDLIESLSKLGELMPGIEFKDTLLYGLEIKFYTSRIKVNEKMETPIENLFCVGDGAGITRGLAQAAISGMIAAEEISKRA